MVTSDRRPPDVSAERFEFGQNWSRFLTVLDDARIGEAERSLRDMLGIESLAGRTFLDVGSGSGVFSLAAMRLGAARVHSFDYDPDSVRCAEMLKERYFAGDSRWTVERGDVLDREYLARLGTWDVVYSWGVLHHTGDMWQALENVAMLVCPGGSLWIAIYNDQGRQSRVWFQIKRLYNRDRWGKAIVTSLGLSYFALGSGLMDLLRLRNPLVRYRNYYGQRGMSLTHDRIDWLGGYPFEVAKPEEIFDFYSGRGFTLERMTTCGGGWGCNQFVFRRER